MATIAVVIPNLEKQQAELAALAEGMGHRVVFAASQAPGAADALRAAEIVIGWNDACADACLRDGTALRWVQLYSAGADTTPLAALDGYGVVVTNASGVHAKPIAETVFAMLLALTRGLVPSIHNQRQHLWQKPQDVQSLPEIHGCTLGVLGVGHVGAEVGRIAAEGFAMRVLGLAHHHKDVPHFSGMYLPGQLHPLLAECDLVVNTLPLTDETEGMINDEAFAAMKPGAVYINVGRGKTTDTGALVAALETGRLAAAGLDVTEPEPLPQDSALWGMDNVVITPHIAGNNAKYNERFLHIFSQNLQAYSKSMPLPVNVVDIQREY